MGKLVVAILIVQRGHTLQQERSQENSNPVNFQLLIGSEVSCFLWNGMLIWIMRFILARRIKGLRTYTLGLRAWCSFAERQWILKGFWAFLHTWHQALTSTRKCLKLPFNLSVGV